MDANGTRFHLLLGAGDWGACQLETPDEPLSLAQAWDYRAGRPYTLPPGWDEARFAQELEELAVPGWDERRAELTLPVRIFQFTAAPKDVPSRLVNRRGAAGDVYDNLYWIADDEQAILIRSAGSGNTTLFWTRADAVQGPTENMGGDFRACVAAPPPPLRLRGLTVTSEHYLVVGVLEPAGLLLFDLHAGGPPIQFCWPTPPPGSPAFAPFDMAATPNGGLWILDRELAMPRLARLWALDRRMAVVVPGAGASTTPPAPDFAAIGDQPAPVGEACRVQTALSYDAAFILRSGDAQAVNGLVAVESLPDGTALILDNAGDGEMPLFARFLRYTYTGPLGGDELSTRVLQDLVDETLRPTFSLQGQDCAFLPSVATNSGESAPVDEPGQILGTLYLVAQDGNQAYAFRVAQRDEPPVNDAVYRQIFLSAQPTYLPMRLFGGRSLLAGTGRVFYDTGRVDPQWIPLVEQKRPRFGAEATLLTPLAADDASPGSGARPAFDGGQPDCVWHRLMLDACIPPDGAVEIWSRAANWERDLAFAPWQREPRLYRRGDGTELPFLRTGAFTSSASTPAAGSDQAAGTWELLFQAARGRFLQVKLRLSGNGRISPRLAALRVYYPRFSYTEHYLPAVYRQDAAAASFLERFLANLEGMYTALEDQIANVQILFDVRSVPARYLEWLAGWFGVLLDPTWDEARRRLFIAHAAELFAQRGTLPGLLRAIRLATDACPDERIFTDQLGSRTCANARTRAASVRIVEHYRTRRAPGLIFGDPTQAEGPGLTTDVTTWTPNQGAEPLHERFRSYLQRRYESLEALAQTWGTPYTTYDEITLPPIRPPNPAMASDWEDFLRTGLGFSYAPVGPADLPLYRAFLTRRYGLIDQLNERYELTGSSAYASFNEVVLPTTLPAGGAPLHDWIQFVAIVAPTQRNAHRFTVLVPTLTGAQTATDTTLLERVRQVVELEKPAHTLFEIKEFWALFRVGEARVELDTVLDQGSRLAPLVLDASYLAQGYLNFSHPWQATNRRVLGRDQLVGTSC